MAGRAKPSPFCQPTDTLSIQGIVLVSTSLSLSLLLTLSLSLPLCSCLLTAVFLPPLLLLFCRCQFAACCCLGFTLIWSKFAVVCVCVCVSVCVRVLGRFGRFFGRSVVGLLDKLSSGNTNSHAAQQQKLRQTAGTHTHTCTHLHRHA